MVNLRVHRAVNLRMALAFSILLPTAVFAQEQDRRGCSINVVALDGSAKPIGAVRVQLKRDGVFVGDTKTNDAGRAEFNGLALGSYNILLSKEGFQNAAGNGVLLADGSAMEVEFVLVSQLERRESIDVRAQAGPLDQAASPSARLQSNEVKQLPSRPATIADTLPLVPGIARSPDGEIKIDGSGEHRSALLVNAADVTDPATGRFGVTVPVDSAEVINVFKTPFLAEYGRFTAGVVSVETRRGGEKWHFELNDPLPDFRIRSWRLRGLRDASPRLSLNGPLIANRLYFSEGLEYDIQKQPIRTVPFT
ncbi:MAG: carboxypeptidase regulatory-like domain-containing protein [Acidobacteria bacterium]|nr:carboxypeptidase regulatory-like domain-containing protein [Acidobacteriota bacterium]